VPDVAASLAALAVSAFTSATILPGTSEVLLLALASSEAASAWLLLLVASAANVAGSSVNWLIGRFFAARLRGTRWLPDEAGLERAARWFRRWGKWSLLAAWVPIVGDPLTLVAGLLRVRYPAFLLIVAIGKTARYAAILTLARQF
jgi:membrane protein YqaA with SNARE-associated domain